MNVKGRRQAAVATLAGTGSTVVITVAQAFVLIPLCLTHLGTHLYGGWLGASQLLVWVQLLDMGIPNLMTQRIGTAFGSRDQVSAARWVVTGLTILMAIAALLAAVATFAAPLVTTWARVPATDSAAFTDSFRLGALASAMLLASNGAIGISRGVQMTAFLSTVQVTGAFVGLVASVVLLVGGFGIWALSLGLFARAVISFIGSAWFLVRARTRAGLPWVRPSAAVLSETLGLAPAMAAGSAGYLLANNSEVLLVTTIFGPAAATIYSLTGRAIDGVRVLLDSVAWAVYGGFAHLVSADDRHRARAVLQEILELRLAVACLFGAVAVAANRPFVTLLFGAEHFGGIWLTTAFAVQMIVGGHLFLANYLLRAAGRVREGSFLLAGEAIARVAAMTGGLFVFGLAGAPTMAAVSSVFVLAVTLRWLDRDLPRSSVAAVPRRFAARAAPIVVFGFGLAIGLIYVPASWLTLSIFSAGVLLFGAGFLWSFRPPALGLPDEALGRVGGMLRRWTRT